MVDDLCSEVNKAEASFVLDPWGIHFPILGTDLGTLEIQAATTSTWSAPRRHYTLDVHRSKYSESSLKPAPKNSRGRRSTSDVLKNQFRRAQECIDGALWVQLIKNFEGAVKGRVGICRFSGPF